MEVNVDPSDVGLVTGGLLGLAAALRFAFKTFLKDKIDVNAAGATNEVISTLRSEVSRLAEAVTELSKANKELREERDAFHSQILHFTYVVNALKSVVVEVIGEEEANKRFKDRGIEVENGEERDQQNINP